MDDDARRQRELDDLDGGMDLREILERRVDVAQAKQGDALDQMRAVMSDAEVFDEFGIDISQA